VETPPQRFRAKSADASHSHDKSKAPKRCLSAELQEAATPPNKKLINLGPSNPAPKKKTKTPEDKKKEQEEAKQAAYEMKDHATATSSADPMPGASKLAKKGSPKGPQAKASPAAKKATSPATTKAKDSTAPSAEKPTKTPTEKSTPPGDTTEGRQNKKARTKSPEKNPKKARGRSPPGNSPKKARAASSPKKPSTASPKKSPKKAPESANKSPEKPSTESPETSGARDAGNKKSEKDPATVENKKKARKLYMRFWRSVNVERTLGRSRMPLPGSSIAKRRCRPSTRISCDARESGSTRTS